MNIDTCGKAYFHTLMLVLGIAAAYYATGRLGLLLAIPPGYASPVWPAAGIALARSRRRSRSRS